MIVVGSTSLRLFMRIFVATVEVAIAVLHATDVVGECRGNERRDDCQRIDKLHGSGPFSTWLTVGLPPPTHAPAEGGGRTDSRGQRAP